MKLRNKKTGEIVEFNEEWEDYEESELERAGERWYVGSAGDIGNTVYLFSNDTIKLAEIGNSFRTKKEAEKAVEKLKAWKRLKDKGFKFEGIKEDFTRILQSQEPFRTGKRYLQFNKSEDEEWMEENWKDLDLIFGGEE